MATKLIPMDLNATLREEPDKSFTIVVEISGSRLPTLRFGSQTGSAKIRDNPDMLGNFEKPPMRQ